MYAESHMYVCAHGIQVIGTIPIRPGEEASGVVPHHIVRRGVKKIHIPSFEKSEAARTVMGSIVLPRSLAYPYHPYYEKKNYLHSRMARRLGICRAEVPCP